MKNSSNFTKKFLWLFMVLTIGFIGGLLGNVTSSKLNKNNTTTTKVNHVTTSYKNTNSTTQAVNKVKDAVVSVIPMLIINLKIAFLEMMTLIVTIITHKE